MSCYRCCVYDFIHLKKHTHLNVYFFFEIINLVTILHSGNCRHISYAYDHSYWQHALNFSKNFHTKTSQQYEPGKNTPAEIARSQPLVPRSGLFPLTDTFSVSGSVLNIQERNVLRTGRNFPSCKYGSLSFGWGGIPGGVEDDAGT